MEASVKKVSHSGSSTTFIQSIEKEKNKNKLHLNFQDKTQHITGSNENPVHVVKIKVNPSTVKINISSSGSTMHKSEVTSVSSKASSPNNASYFYYNQYPGIVLPSAQSSPSDTLDSGTCSDLDGSTPPPLPKKKSIVTFSSEGSSVAGSSINSDDEISCDSLNSSELEEIVENKKHEDDNNIDYKASFKEKQKLFAQRIKTLKENSVVPKSNPLFDAQISNGKNSFIEKLNAFEQNQILVKKTKIINNKHSVSKVSFNSNIIRHDNDNSECKENSSSENQIIESDNANNNVNNISLTNIVPILKKTSVTHVEKEITPTLNEGPCIVDESLPSENSETSNECEMVNNNNNPNCVRYKVEKLVINSDQEDLPLPKMKFKLKEIQYEDDQHYKFHLNENNFDSDENKKTQTNDEDDHFAGYKNLDGMVGSATSTIKSSKGTIRGVKNRVRAGIATFLTMPTTKVSYNPSMHSLAQTPALCCRRYLPMFLVRWNFEKYFLLDM